MPPGDSSFNGIIAAMSRLAGIVGGLSKDLDKLGTETERQNKLREKENILIEKHNKSVEEEEKLKDELSGTITSSNLFKKLEQIASKGFAGNATPQVKQNLAKAAAYRKQYLASRKQYQTAGQQIQKLKSMRPHAANRPALQKLNQRISNLQSHQQNLGLAAFKHKQTMQAALQRSKQLALGSGTRKKLALAGMSSTTMLKSLSRVSGILSAVVVGTTHVLGKFKDELAESSEIVAKFSRFSLGGMHAVNLMYVRDMQRNILISKVLSESMMKFAKANADMKDAWSGTTIVMNKSSLAIGQIASDLAGKLGKKIDFGAKVFDKMMAFLNKGGKAAEDFLGKQNWLVKKVGEGLQAVAKWVDWQEVEDDMKKVQEAIKRRKAGNPLPGDLHPWERALGAFNRVPMIQRNIPRFQRPDKPDPGVNPNVGLPGAPIAGQGQGMNADANRPIVNRKIQRKIDIRQRDIKVLQNDQRDLQRAIEAQEKKANNLGMLRIEERREIDKKIDELKNRQLKAARQEEEAKKALDNLIPAMPKMGNQANRQPQINNDLARKLNELDIKIRLKQGEAAAAFKAFDVQDRIVQKIEEGGVQANEKDAFNRHRTMREDQKKRFEQAEQERKDLETERARVQNFQARLDIRPNFNDPWYLAGDPFGNAKI